MAGYQAVLSRTLTGRAQTVFVEVRLTSQRADVLDAFEAAVQSCPGLRSCHLMAGDADYLLCIEVSDVSRYEEIHRTHLAGLPGLASMRSTFALRTVAEGLPVGLGQEP